MAIVIQLRAPRTLPSRCNIAVMCSVYERSLSVRSCSLVPCAYRSRVMDTSSVRDIIQNIWSIPCFRTNHRTLSPRLKNNKKFWEQLIAYFTLTRHGPYRKRRLQQFTFAAETCSSSRSLATTRGYTDSRLYFDMTRTGQKTTRPTKSLLLLVYSLDR
jgi:hypothetical protein